MTSRTIPFRHPGQPHSLNEAFAASKINGIVAGCIGAEPADGETWIERKPRIHRSPPFVQLSEPRECGGELEMRERIVSVCVQAPTHPTDCFAIGTELHLGKADIYQPFRSKGVARRKPECLVDVRFGFFAPTKKKLREADKSMSAG